MPPTSAQTAMAAGAASKGNKSLRGLMTAAVWAILIPACVDFSLLMNPEATSNSNAGIDLTPSPVTRALKISLILISLGVIFGRFSQARVLFKRMNMFFILFTLMMIFSILWSVDPNATINRCVSYGTSVLVSIAFCLVAWDRTRFQTTVRPLLTVVMALGLLYILLDPKHAIDPDFAGYHGLSTQKNPYGEVCAIAVLLWMHAWIARESKWYVALIGGGICWACLVLSKSATSLLATVLATMFLLMLLKTGPALRRYMPYIIVAFAGLVIAYALAVLDLIPGLSTLLLGPIAAITGKDMTFTNRTAIWEVVKQHAQGAPWLGTGYGAYWTGPVPTSQSFEVLVRIYFWPSESHNGYLEVFNDLGFVGLAVLVGFLAVYVRQSLLLFKLDRAQAALYLAIFFQQAVTNLSESCWFSANGVMPVIIVNLATCALARNLIMLNATGGRQPGRAATGGRAMMPGYPRGVARRY